MCFLFVTDRSEKFPHWLVVVESSTKHSITCAWIFASENSKDLIKESLNAFRSACCKENNIEENEFQSTIMVDKCEHQADALVELGVRFL